METLLSLSIDDIDDLSILNPQAVIGIIKETLRRLDPRLIDHGDRVSFIVHEVMCHSGRYSQEQIDNLCAMAFFHDVGAYKTDEIDQMVSFETDKVWQHSIYGYIFLKHFTPMGEDAEAILYHHMHYSDTEKSSSLHLDNAMLLHICDRMDILMQLGRYSDDYFIKHCGKEFAPWCVDLLLEGVRERDIRGRIENGEYCDVAAQIATAVCSTPEKALDYLMMLIYIIDFKSPATVTHTINTVAFSVLLSRMMGLATATQGEIYLGALLHDLGKIAIPYEILESIGSLSHDEMEIMKTHVSITYEILKDNLPEHICRIAARHHEKLDGAGYPWALRAPDLTVSERIVAVADVMSALTGRRSYKKEFSPDRTKRILTQMADDGKLDKEICRMATDNYSEIIEAAKLYCQAAIESYEQMMKEYGRLLDRIIG